MSKLLTSSILVGFGLLSGLIYSNYDLIKVEIMKRQSILKAESVTIDFFYNLINQNNNITLDEAILKFENKYDDFKNLEDFATSKQRSAEGYRKAYSKLFKRAKLKYNFKI